MQCPKCQNTMREREKGDVIIDVCPACQGIWLDRGEMEKLIQFEDRYYRRDDDDDDNDHAYGGRYGDRPREDYDPRRVDDHDRRGPYDRDPRTQNYPAKKRKSFLGGIFEGFGDD